MSPAQKLVVRPARTSDVRAIRVLVDTYAPDRRLLSKATVTLLRGRAGVRGRPSATAWSSGAARCT